MKISVRKNNVAKAVSRLSKEMSADGDLMRYIERSNGYMSKGQKRRRKKSLGIARSRKELMSRIEEDANGN